MTLLRRFVQVAKFQHILSVRLSVSQMLNAGHQIFLVLLSQVFLMSLAADVTT